MLEEWKKLREQGFTYKAIADKYNVSKQAIYEALDKAGVKRKTKYSKYYEEWERLYQKGFSTQEIADQYNCNQKTVYHYLSKKLIINADEAAIKGWKKRNKMKNVDNP